MAIDEFALGAGVESQDGERLGSIKTLIVDVASNRIGGLLFDHGLFAPPKIVEMDQVAGADAQGVVLTLDAPAAAGLPRYFHEQYQRVPNPLAERPGPGDQQDAHGPGEGWVKGEASSSVLRTRIGMFFIPDSEASAETEDVSNVPAEEVFIGERTDIVDAGGHKLGHLASVLVDGEGKMTGIVVKSGLLVSHELSVPIAAVAGIAHDHIRLDVTKEALPRTSESEVAHATGG